MAADAMKVLEVLDQLEVLLGATVEIEGFLLRVRGHSFIAQDGNSSDASCSILLADQNATERLVGTASVWVGGPSIYREDVCVTGILRRSDTQPFRAQLEAVTHLEIVRPEETVAVVSNRQRDEQDHTAKKLAEVEVLFAERRADFIYLALRLIRGGIDAGNLLARPGEQARWRITGVGTGSPQGFADGLRGVSAVKWTEDEGIPRAKEILIAAEGPPRI